MRSDAEAHPGFRSSFPLVEAKLHPPAQRPGTISRERLIRLLMAAPSPPAVSIVAPPGYGKTMLLAEWVAREQRPVAWLTLDDFDNVPSVFLAYVAAAIDRIEPIDASIEAAMLEPGTRILAAAVPRLAFDLHRIGRPALLVLDDVHRLVDRTCLDALAALLDHLPPGFQVAMASRTTPKLPLGRMRVERDLMEISRDDLALDLVETVALTSAAGFPLNPGEARALVERTEGWAAGIYLATLAGRRSDTFPGAAGGVPTQATFIAEYLRSELLPGLADDDVTFLTRSSILDVVEPPIAEAVTGLLGAAARLAALGRANQLIGEVGGTGGAYRYHNLLREFLQAELERREPGLSPLLHRRAATSYADAGRRELAVEHAFLGNDIDAASSLFLALFLAELYGGNADKLDRWLRTFDDAAFQRKPPLAVAGAWIHLLNGRPEDAVRLADIADASTFSGDPHDGSASFESSRAILRAVMARHGPEDMLVNAMFAASAERPGSPWRTNALLMVGSAHLLLGDEVAADAAFTDAVEAGGIAGALVSWASRASLAMARRDWTAAGEFARESRAIIARAQLAHILPSLATYAVAARIAIHHGDLAQARQELVRAQLVRPLATYAAPWVAVGALLELARAYLAIADPAGARNVLSEADAIVRRRPALGTLNASLEEIRRDPAGGVDHPRWPVGAVRRGAPPAPDPVDLADVQGDRRAHVPVPSHRQDPGHLDLREAGGIEPERGRPAGDRSRPARAVPRPPAGAPAPGGLTGHPADARSHRRLLPIGEYPRETARSRSARRPVGAGSRPPHARRCPPTHRRHIQGRTSMADNQVILAVFADEAAADAAVESLKAWDKASDEVKLSSIGVLVLDDKGALKVNKMGSAQQAKTGAGIGLVLAIVAPPTLLAGVVGGGILGSFHHKGLGLKDEDKARIGAELTGGKAAVGVLASGEEAGAILGKLAELGGAVEAIDVTDEALDAVAEAAPETEAPAASA